MDKIRSGDWITSRYFLFLKRRYSKSRNYSVDRRDKSTTNSPDRAKYNYFIVSLSWRQGVARTIAPAILQVKLNYQNFRLGAKYPCLISN